MSQALSVDTHCQMLVSQIIDRLDKIYDAFKSFVSVFSGLVGAALAIRLQYGPQNVHPYFVLADGLAVLLAAMTSLLIVENSYSWYRLRKRLSEVAGADEDFCPIIAQPTLLRSSRIEIAMLVMIVLATILFLIWNPLR